MDPDSVAYATGHPAAKTGLDDLPADFCDQCDARDRHGRRCQAEVDHEGPHMFGSAEDCEGMGV